MRGWVFVYDSKWWRGDDRWLNDFWIWPVGDGIGVFETVIALELLHGFDIAMLSGGHISGRWEDKVLFRAEFFQHPGKEMSVN